MGPQAWPGADPGGGDERSQLCTCVQSQAGQSAQLVNTAGWGGGVEEMTAAIISRSNFILQVQYLNVASLLSLEGRCHLILCELRLLIQHAHNIVLPPTKLSFQA